MLTLTFKNIARKPSKTESRYLWVKPITGNTKQAKQTHQKIKDSMISKKPMSSKDAHALIAAHVSQTSTEVYKEPTVKQMTMAASSLNLMIKLPSTTEFWRGECIEKSKILPNGLYELTKHTSVTNSFNVAFAFSRDVSDFYPFKKSKENCIIKFIIPASFPMIKIPESYLDEGEHLLLKGTLISVENIPSSDIDSFNKIVKVLHYEEKQD